MTEPHDAASLLFLARTHTFKMAVADTDSPSGSRVGGPPPEPAVRARPKCPVCEGPLEYVLTLSSDILLQDPESPVELSFFCCASECKHGAHKIVDPSPLVFVAHPPGDRASAGSGMDSPAEGRALVASLVEDGEPTSDDAKVGGQAGYLQGWGARQEQAAADRGMAFLFQWSESCFPRTMKTGPYPFFFGTAYAFCPIDAATGRPALDRVAAFWQNA